MNSKIYFDNASGSPMLAEVYRVMLDSFNNTFASSVSMHSFGCEAYNALEESRDKIAKTIGANKDEIYFTSSTAESNSWAIKCLARANSEKGKHIIISAIEDKSIIDSANSLKNEGFEVSIIPVDSDGIIDYTELVKTIRRDTVLISVQAANNMIGTIEPIHAIAKLAEMNGIIFHTDASYAYGEFEINVEALSIDAMTISSSAIHGPSGIAALYIKNGIKIQNLIFGADYENGKRAGNILVPAAVGFAKAAEIATNNMQSNVKNRRRLRKMLFNKIKENIANVELVGHIKQRISGNLNIAIEGIDGESACIFLNEKGIAASASESPLNYPSHVIEALNFEGLKKYSTIRFSISTLNNEDEVNQTVKVLTKVVKKLRSVSPVRVYNMRGGK